MPKLYINIETNYGTLTVQGDSQEEILEALDLLTDDFIEQVNEKVALLELKDVESELDGIVRVTTDGPVIVTRAELSHYEIIGLILYSMRHHEATSKQIRDRIEASGKDVIVPARLNEMKKRGHVFRPSGKGSEYKLTAKGLEWMEEEVLEKLRREED
jgi:phosphoglycerate-specific signal transduction histidine kinase